MICRVFVNVFDALVHVSECRRKAASTAEDERMTETTGTSLWEKVVMKLRHFALPRVSAFWWVMPSPEPSLGCGRVRRRGSVGILRAVWGAPVGLKKAALPCHALPVCHGGSCC